ncbi:hypothetical protein D3C78_1292380 [compost metagenome]
MPGHRVDRLHFATETRQGTRIDQGQVCVTQALGQVLGIDQQLAVRLTVEGAFPLERRVQAERQVRRMPGLQATVEDRHAAALAQPGQQPPGTGGKSARAIVVQHHLAVIVQAPLTQALDQPARIRQRVAPGAPLAHRPAEITLQVGKMRPGNMPLGIAALAIVHILEGKAAVEDHQLGRA